MKLKLTACIDAPKEKVWAVLSDLAAIHLWVAPVSSAECSGERNRGVGTVRVCGLRGNVKVKEEFTAWSEGHSFTYRASDVPMVKFATNQWSVESTNGKTLVTTESEVILKGGVLGGLLVPLMRLWSRKAGTESLAALKYLVENGHAYVDSPSRLPKAPLAC